jgi:hypothetical protein
MGQLTFGDLEYAGKRKATRRELFLAEMDQIVPWKSLLGLIEPFYPLPGRGRQPYPLQTMLRMHLMQNWFGLVRPAHRQHRARRCPHLQRAPVGSLRLAEIGPGRRLHRSTARRSRPLDRHP